MLRVCVPLRKCGGECDVRYMHCLNECAVVRAADAVRLVRPKCTLGVGGCHTQTCQISCVLAAAADIAWQPLVIDILQLQDPVTKRMRFGSVVAYLAILSMPPSAATLVKKFLESKHFAVVGATNRRDKFGNKVQRRCRAIPSVSERQQYSRKYRIQRAYAIKCATRL